MSWAVGQIDGRDVGYGVPAVCDHPECGTRIDRGLSYKCESCNLFFCSMHRVGDACDRCLSGELPYDPKPDIAEWLEHKETHPSWAQWRQLQAMEKELQNRELTDREKIDLDILLYGTGFGRFRPDGSIEHIPAPEVLVFGKEGLRGQVGKKD